MSGAAVDKKEKVYVQISSKHNFFPFQIFKGYFAQSSTSGCKGTRNRK